MGPLVNKNTSPDQPVAAPECRDGMLSTTFVMKKLRRRTDSKGGGLSTLGGTDGSAGNELEPPDRPSCQTGAAVGAVIVRYRTLRSGTVPTCHHGFPTEGPPRGPRGCPPSPVACCTVSCSAGWPSERRSGASSCFELVCDRLVW